MLLRFYLYGLFVILLSSLVSFWALIYFENPKEADFLTIFLVFFSLFLFFVSFFTLLGFWFRLSFSKKGTILSYFKPSLRQGILLSLAGLGTLAFSASGLLNGWTILFLVVILFLFELIFKVR